MPTLPDPHQNGKYPSDASSELDGLITLHELRRCYGLTACDVLQRCPHAVEYTGLDGESCWLREDLIILEHAR